MTKETENEIENDEEEICEDCDYQITNCVCNDIDNDGRICD